MIINQLVEKLDQMLLEGKFRAAVEAFFHPEVVFFSSPADRQVGRENRLRSLQAFFETVQEIREARLHRRAVSGDESYSHFTFSFLQHDGHPLQWEEVIARKWAEGKVVEERYYTSGNLDEWFGGGKQAVVEGRMQQQSTSLEDEYSIEENRLTIVEHVNEVIPDNDRKGLVRNVQIKESGVVGRMEVSVDISHTFRGDLHLELESPSGETLVLQSREGVATDDLHKTYGPELFQPLVGSKVKGNWIFRVLDSAMRDVGSLNWWRMEIDIEQSDDLKKIEGIGPKIESLLKEAGLFSYLKLANASPGAIRDILAAAGKRYLRHDPTTWPRQARLAYLGKWEELKELQEELHGGRIK